MYYSRLQESHIKGKSVISLLKTPSIHIEDTPILK